MNALPPADGLLPGLPDPVLDSQRVFRAVLDAMAHPGTIRDLALRLEPPPPLALATAAVALALLDFETPLWLDGAAGIPAVAGFLRFHCGCPLTADRAAAAFAVVAAPAVMPPLAGFASGSDSYPDRSATLVIQVPSLSGGEAWGLAGPGIPGSRGFAPAGLPAGFRSWLAANHALFPRGIDLIFTCGSAVAALPRTTRLED